MAGSLGQAVVEIIAETGDFDDEVRRELEDRIDEVARNVQEDLDRIALEAEQSGRRLSDALGEGADDASERVQRLGRIAREASEAFEALDPDELDRIAREAQEAQREMAELARAARSAEGVFSGMDPGELERIARVAEHAGGDMERLERRAREAARQIERFGDEGEVRRLAEEIQRAQRAADDLGRTRLQRIGREAQQAGRAIWFAFRGAGEESRRALERVNNTRFREVVRRASQAGEQIRRAFDRARRFGPDLERSVTRVGRAFTRLLTAAATITQLGAALSGLVAIAGVVVAVLAPSLGLLAGIPAAALLAGAAVGTLAVALSGVGEAFSAALTGDAAAFEEAIKGLAPPARKVAKELRTLKPEIDKLRKSVQGAFFRPLVGELTAVARNLGGPLRRGMTATAAQFGRLAKSVTTFGRSAEAASLVEGVFRTLSGTLRGVKSGTITNLLGSVSRFTRQTLPAFDGLGGAIDNVAVRLTGFLDRAVQGGDALRWLQEGIAGAKALGAVLLDVGQIAGGLFRAMQTASEGALGSFATVAADLADFASSAKGQAQLVEVFRAVNAVAAQTGPVIRALVGALAGLGPIVAQLAAELGPTLTAAIGALGPALQGLGRGLVPVFAGIRAGVESIAESGALRDLGVALGQLVAAVAPLGPAIGNVLVSAFRSLAVAAAVVAPVVRVVAAALSALLNSPLGAALGPLIAQLILVRLVTGSWGTALKSLLPVLKLVGKGAAGLGKGLIAAITRHPIGAVIVGIALALAFVATRFQAVRDALSRFKDAAVDALNRLKAFGASLLSTFRTDGPVAALRQLGSALVSGLGSAISAGLRLIPRLITGILSGLAAAASAVPGLLTQLGQAVQAGLNKIATEAPAFARRLAAGLATAFGALREQAPQILSSLRAALLGAMQALATEGPRIGAALKGLLSSAFSALASEGPRLAQQAAAMFAQVNATLLRLAAEGIRRAGDSIAQHLPTVATKIAAFLSGMITKAGEVIPQVLAQLSARISGGLGQAVGQAASGAGGGGAGGALQQSLIKLILDVGLAVVEQIPKLIPVIGRAMLTIGLAVAQAAAQAAPGILAAVANLLLTAGQALLMSIGSFLTGLPGRIIGWLAGLAPSLASAGTRGMMGLLRGLVTGVGTVIGYMIGVPIRIAAAIAALAIYLGQRGLQAMSRLRSALASGAASAVGFMRSLPGRLASAIASLPSLLTGRGNNAMSRFRSALVSGGNAAASFMRSLPGRIVGALGGLAGQLAGVGRAAMQGFISGARSLAGSMVDAVVGPIRDAINAAKGMLKIGSPSKVFRDIGKFVGKGFVQGLTGEAGKIKSTADKLVGLVTAAFKGKRSRVDDRLVAMVKAANTRLQALAKQRDKIAETIKAANEKAAEVAKAARDFGALTTVAGTADAPATAADLVSGLQDRLATIRKFQADVERLARRGLSKDLLSQLIAAGPEQGGALAAALSKAGDSAIRDLNATNNEIVKASGALGQSSADLLYDSGRRAGEGFLAGLKAQQADIVKLMTRLAQQVAATVKKTLKIRSPSRVMSGLGADTIEGFLEGIAQEGPQIEAALARALDLANLHLPQMVTNPRLRALASNGLAELAQRLSVPAAPAPAAARPAPAAPVTIDDKLLARLIQAAGPRTVKNTEVHAPVNVTVPTGDPEAAGQIISARIAAAVAR